MNKVLLFRDEWGDSDGLQLALEQAGCAVTAIRDYLKSDFPQSTSSQAQNGINLVIIDDVEKLGPVELLLRPGWGSVDGPPVLVLFRSQVFCSQISPLQKCLPRLQALKRPYRISNLAQEVTRILNGPAVVIAQRPRVLLVDDDSSIRAVLSYILEDAGFDVVTAAGGEEALMRCRSDSVDVVITDMLMTNGSGEEFVTQLRRFRKDLPLIAVTGELGEGAAMLRAARQQGVQATLTKPFSSKELLAALSQILDSANTNVQELRVGQSAHSLKCS